MTETVVVEEEGLSQSSKVYAVLRAMPVGLEFTSKDVCRMVKEQGVSDGAVCAFLFKCVKYGMISRVGYRTQPPGSEGRLRLLVYRMDDPERPVPHFRGPGVGSLPGRRVNRSGPAQQPRLDGEDDNHDEGEARNRRAHKKRSPPMTMAALVEQLLTLASIVEQMKPDVSSVPTDVLLAELRRRTK
jgi:hypothetical protein